MASCLDVLDVISGAGEVVTVLGIVVKVLVVAAVVVMGLFVVEVMVRAVSRVLVLRNAAHMFSRYLLSFNGEGMCIPLVPYAD